VKQKQLSDGSGLHVGPPEERKEQEDFQSLEGTGDLANKGVIPCDAFGPLPGDVVRGLHWVPESWLPELYDGFDRVPRDPFVASNPEDLEALLLCD